MHESWDMPIICPNVLQRYAIGAARCDTPPQDGWCLFSSHHISFHTEGILRSSVTHAFPALETRKLDSLGTQNRSGTTNRDQQWPPNCLPMELSILVNRSSLPIQWSQMFVTFPLVKRGPTTVTNIGIQRYGRIPCTRN